MHRVLVLGAGKIGSLVACLLSQQGAYEVHLADLTLDAPKHLVEDLGLSRITPAVLDVRHPETVETYLSAHPVDAIISSLPYFCNPTVAALALKHRCHYFDLTEDVEVTNHIHNAVWHPGLSAS
jgi:saccharopine dehydrogenase-like NADP-dependent oxidoreductase